MTGFNKEISSEFQENPPGRQLEIYCLDILSHIKGYWPHIVAIHHYNSLLRDKEFPKIGFITLLNIYFISFY